MILLFSVIVGLSAGLLRAAWHRQSLNTLRLTGLWLVIIAVLPQLFVFNNAVLRSEIPDNLAKGVLIASQGLLLVFVWLNRRAPGLSLAGIGLGLNFLVIVLNGGLMPISPQMVQHLVPGADPASWALGERLWSGKDVVLPLAATRLSWLSDYFTLPAGIPYRVAFSIGDCVLSCGIIWLLGSLGNKHLSLRSEFNDGSGSVTQHVPEN